MKKIVIPVLIVTLALCAICAVGGIYLYNAFQKGDYSKFGFMSFLSGSQADLGVTYTDADAARVLENNGLTTTSTCPAGTSCSSSVATYIGTKAVSATLSNSEGTALINQWIKLSRNAPFSSAQMRVNADGSVDFAATVDMARLRNFGNASHVPADMMDLANKYTGPLGASFPVYASGTLSITNNKVNADFSSFKVGFIPVPDAVFKDSKSTIDSFIQDRLAVVSGLSVEELSFAGGKTTFKGTLPQTIVYAK